MAGVRRLLLLAAALLLVSTPGALAAATPEIVQTDCDTLSFDPPRVRVTFGIINLGNTPVCGVVLRPQQSGQTPPDSCAIIECGSAPGWHCGAHEGNGFWDAELDPHSGDPDCIDMGEKHEPFSVVLDPLFCCYNAAFYAPAIPEAFYAETVCFECDKPVQASAKTWGRVKSYYR